MKFRDYVYIKQLEKLWHMAKIQNQSKIKAYCYYEYYSVFITILFRRHAINIERQINRTTLKIKGKGNTACKSGFLIVINSLLCINNIT